MLTTKQQDYVLCEECVKTFGADIAQSATMVMTKDSILLKGKVLVKHVCDEHSVGLWEDGWECV